MPCDAVVAQLCQARCFPAVATLSPTVGVMWLTSETSVDPPSAGWTSASSVFTVVSTPSCARPSSRCSVPGELLLGFAELRPAHRLEVALHGFLERAVEQVLVQAGVSVALKVVRVASAAPSAIFGIHA